MSEAQLARGSCLVALVVGLAGAVVAPRLILGVQDLIDALLNPGVHGGVGSREPAGELLVLLLDLLDRKSVV